MDKIREFVQDSIDDFKEDLEDAGFGEEDIIDIKVKKETPVKIHFVIEGAVYKQKTYNKLMGDGLAPIAYEGRIMLIEGKINKCSRCPYPKMVNDSE